MTNRVTRAQKFAMVLKAIESQPYEVYTAGDVFASRTSNRTLRNFVEDTWVSQYADEMFRHVANRVLDALDSLSAGTSVDPKYRYDVGDVLLCDEGESDPCVATIKDCFTTDDGEVWYDTEEGNQQAEEDLYKASESLISLHQKREQLEEDITNPLCQNKSALREEIVILREKIKQVTESEKQDKEIFHQPN